MYGTQTIKVKDSINLEFENDVKMYGTQTKRGIERPQGRFENDVKMYGTQTKLPFGNTALCLRMM